MLPKVDIVNDKFSLRNNDTLIEHDNNNFLSIKRERGDSLLNNNDKICINCSKIFDKELLCFKSCSDIIKYIQSHCIFNNCIRNDILSHCVNDNQKEINVKMCHKCFYNILINKGLNWFYSGKFNSLENEKKIMYRQIDFVYRMCFAKLVKYINNVNKELLCNKTEHDNLMKKIFLRYFFGKGQQSFMKYNEDMHICQKKIEDSLNILKYLNETMNDYINHNKQIKVFPKNELEQILNLIRNLRNVPLFINSLNYSFPLAITSNHINNVLLYNPLINIPKETNSINNNPETSKVVYNSNIFGTKINDNNINLFNTNGFNPRNITQPYLPYTLYDLRINNYLDLNNSLQHNNSLSKNQHLHRNKTNNLPQPTTFQHPS